MLGVKLSGILPAFWLWHGETASGKFARCVSGSRAPAAGVPSFATSPVLAGRRFGSHRPRSWGELCRTTSTESSYEGTSQRQGPSQEVSRARGRRFRERGSDPLRLVTTVVVVIWIAAQAAPP